MPRDARYIAPRFPSQTKLPSHPSRHATLFRGPGHQIARRDRNGGTECMTEATLSIVLMASNTPHIRIDLCDFELPSSNGTGVSEPMTACLSAPFGWFTFPDRWQFGIRFANAVVILTNGFPSATNRHANAIAISMITELARVPRERSRP